MSLPDLLARLLAAEARVPAAVGASLDDLASAVERLVARLQKSDNTPPVQEALPVALVERLPVEGH